MVPVNRKPSVPFFGRECDAVADFIEAVVDQKAGSGLVVRVVHIRPLIQDPPQFMAIGPEPRPEFGIFNVVSFEDAAQARKDNGLIFYGEAFNHFFVAPRETPPRTGFCGTGDISSLPTVP